VVGEPPAGYLRRLRLDRAAEELAAGAQVGRTARRLGYASPDAFTRALKARQGEG
jgi:AraC-like DNA-binding protein